MLWHQTFMYCILNQQVFACISIDVLWRERCIRVPFGLKRVRLSLAFKCQFRSSHPPARNVAFLHVYIVSYFTTGGRRRSK